MNKVIDIRFSNDEIWRVAAHIVAYDRADYYANVDSDYLHDEIYDQCFAAEYDHGMANSDELIDWMQNNMNWEDLEDWAELMPSSYPSYNYNDNYGSAEITVKVI